MTTLHDHGALLLDHPVGRLGRVAIRLASAEIRIVGEDGDRATVRTPGGDGVPGRVVLETTDGGLTIREQEALGLSFGTGRKTVELEVGVPVDADVTIDTASGSVVARGLHGKQHYRTASGDLRVLDAAGRIDINAVSGDATLELAGTVDLAVRTVSGDVNVGGGTLDSVRVQTTSGDVRLESPLTSRTGNTIETLSGDVSVVAVVGMRVEARTVSGDLLSDLPHRSEGRMGRRTIVVGDGSIELGFRSVSGDLRIRDGSRMNGRPAATVTYPVLPPNPPDAPTPPLPPTPATPAIPFVPPLPGATSDSSTLSRVDETEEGPVADGDANPSTTASRDGTTREPIDDERLAILRAIERGELDVATAMDRLSDLDARETGEAGDA